MSRGRKKGAKNRRAAKTGEARYVCHICGCKRYRSLLELRTFEKVPHYKHTKSKTKFVCKWHP